MSAKSADDFSIAVNKLMKTGKNLDIDSARTLVRKYGTDAVLNGISKKGVISPTLLGKMNKYLNNPDALKKLAAQENIILNNAIKNNDIAALIKSDGTLVRGDYTQEDLIKIFKKNPDDISRMADDVDVQNAAKTKKSDLIRLGISGSLVSGVIFLMLLTGKKNPVEAIAEALREAAKAAADTAKETGDFLFKNLFSGMGGLFNISALFLFCSSIAIVLWLVISVVLKK